MVRDIIFLSLVHSDKRTPAFSVVFKGFQVLPAANGRSGIEFAAGSHPDVIILDLTMPDCSGIQVVENLRARAETQNIPILIHTGTVLSEPERLRLAAHVQSITFKAEPATLLTKLEHLDEAPVGGHAPGVNP